MTQIQISLTDAADRFIAEQVASGRYGSPSDVVVELVEKARIQAAKEKLAELILEGENSGEGVEFDETSWDERTKQLLEEAQRRRSA
jgi:putative addiction module CopG family antidote